MDASGLLASDELSSGGGSANPSPVPYTINTAGSINASVPTTAAVLQHAPAPHDMERGAPVPVGATLSQAMDRPGVTMRQSMRAPFACLCCEPNFD
jgi:hypothetical protein